MVLTKIPGELIADNSIATADLADGAVTTAKIAANTVTAAKLSSGAAEQAATGLKSDIALLAFKTQANGNLAKYNLIDQTIDSFEDADGINASASTNELRASTGKYYSGGTAGAEQTVVKSYTGANQTFVVPTRVLESAINFIAWGAAGGSGNNPAGTGGGGGFVEGNVTVVGGETLNVKVGQGGLIAHSSASNPGGGGGGTGIYRSSTVLAIAGAGGAGENAELGGAGGGTTGGAGTSPGAATDANGGTQSAGGAAVDGGGAGALNQGGNAASSSSTAAGGYNGGGSGDGDNTNWTSGGGGGGYYGGSSGGATGSNHGSGAGGSSLTAGTNTQASGSTVANASHPNYASGTGNGVATSAGQHGNAVIKYTEVTTGNMTLVSNSTTAEAAPTKADVVLTYTNGAGTATLNTDLIASVSRDNGTTYTAVTLASQGTTGGETIVSANNVDISGQPSGTSMVWKVATANQSGSKETRIHGVSLGWA